MDGDNRSEGKQSKWGHCAVRVKDSEGGGDAIAEIVPSEGWTMTVGTFSSNSEQFAKFGDKWVPVAVPEGMTRDQFDAAILRELATQTRLYNGAPYWPGGEANSNSFVYKVITGAGGTVPAAASAHIPRVPGICGGSALRTGIRCSH